MAVHSKQLVQDEQESNFFKFSKIVINEFPKALRQTFKLMWNKKFGSIQPWDDSVAVRKSFLKKEGGKTSVPTNQSYKEWDCTALFKATIYAQSFALRDKKGHLKTLSELYVNPRRLPNGSFHTSVISPGGNTAESFALAIDQLRLLRNFHCHSTVAKMDKITFDECVKRAKDAFQALRVKTDEIDAVETSLFLATEVDALKDKNCDMRSFFF